MTNTEVRYSNQNVLKPIRIGKDKLKIFYGNIINSNQ